MRKEQNVENYLDMIVKEGLYTNKGNLKFQLAMCFNKIVFKNKTILDIGGGYGLYSFYAACRGAKKVVCLEPESEGSSLGITDKFYRLKRLLDYNNIEFKAVTLQTYNPEGIKFDVIFLHDSINHLDETACINLLKESKYKAIYQEIFSKINSLLNKGGKLIICDCSRYNFFTLFNIRNPFVPKIEWNKHQAPEVWANLLVEAGFTNPKIQWLSFNTLGYWGKLLLGHKLMAYFLTSYFCLTMNKL